MYLMYLNNCGMRSGGPEGRLPLGISEIVYLLLYCIYGVPNAGWLPGIVPYGLKTRFRSHSDNTPHTPAQRSRFRHFESSTPIELTCGVVQNFVHLKIASTYREASLPSPWSAYIPMYVCTATTPLIMQ